MNTPEIHPALKKRLDRAIRKGGVTLEELRKQAKKNPSCLADVYLKAKGA